LFQVETIGCVYMVVSGLPNRNGQRHVMEITWSRGHVMARSRDGDRANVARPAAGDHRLRAARSDVFQRNTFEARPRPVSFGTGKVSTVGVLG